MRNLPPVASAVDVRHCQRESRELPFGNSKRVEVFRGRAMIDKFNYAASAAPENLQNNSNQESEYARQSQGQTLQDCSHTDHVSSEKFICQATRKNPWKK